ncbi:MAG TPA: hypothetical protein VMU54_15370 [Planctomycetota bacterium]|nr:hypothetical protein [Planctomycetota bacterium]
MKTFGAALLIGSLTVFNLPGLDAQATPPPPGTTATPSSQWTSLKEDIQTLLQAKLSDVVILAYIHRHATALNPSPQDLVDLKQAGASEAVLAAVVESKGKTPPPPAAAPNPSYTYATPDYSSTYVYPAPDATYNYYDYYDPYYYPYGYPYWGFGFSSPFFFRDHDGRFHRFDRFHDGRFGGNVIAPHSFSGHGGVIRGGGGHFGAGGGGHSGGGGGHR